MAQSPSGATLGIAPATGGNIVTVKIADPGNFVWLLQSSRTSPPGPRSPRTPGFRTEFMRFPRERVTVIVLANSDEAKAVVFAELVAEKFLPVSQGK